MSKQKSESDQGSTTTNVLYDYNVYIISINMPIIIETLIIGI